MCSLHLCRLLRDGRTAAARHLEQRPHIGPDLCSAGGGPKQRSDLRPVARGGAGRELPGAHGRHVVQQLPHRAQQLRPGLRREVRQQRRQQRQRPGAQLGVRDGGAPARAPLQLLNWARRPPTRSAGRARSSISGPAASVPIKRMGSQLIKWASWRQPIKQTGSQRAPGPPPGARARGRGYSPSRCLNLLAQRVRACTQELPRCSCTALAGSMQSRQGHYRRACTPLAMSQREFFLCDGPRFVPPLSKPETAAGGQAPEPMQCGKRSWKGSRTSIVIIYRCSWMENPAISGVHCTSSVRLRPRTICDYLHLESSTNLFARSAW